MPKIGLAFLQVLGSAVGTFEILFSLRPDKFVQSRHFPVKKNRVGRVTGTTGINLFGLRPALLYSMNAK
jgi:hypothetical protein